MRVPVEIIDKRARKTFTETCATLKAAMRLNGSTIQLVTDLAILEQVKQRALEEGDTSTVLRSIEQQRKIRRELKLTPATGLEKEIPEDGESSWTY